MNTSRLDSLLQYLTNEFRLYQVTAGLEKTEVATANLNRSYFTSFSLSTGLWRCYRGDAYYEDLQHDAICDVDELKRRIRGDMAFVDGVDRLFEFDIIITGNSNAGAVECLLIVSRHLQPWHLGADTRIQCQMSR